MDVCKNKKSGKYFIYLLNGVNQYEGLFITPDGEQKNLRFDLFYNMEELEEDRENNLLSQAQIQAFLKLNGNELFQSFQLKWDNLTPHKRKEFIDSLK